MVITLYTTCSHVPNLRLFLTGKKKTKPKYLIKQNATLDVISYCVNTYGIEKQNLGSHRY